MWTSRNLKILIRKVSFAYRDFVDVKIVEIAKKLEIRGVDSTNRALYQLDPLNLGSEKNQAEFF